MATKKKLLAEERARTQQSAAAEQAMRARNKARLSSGMRNFWISAGLRFGQAGNSGLLQTYIAGFLVIYLGVERTVATNANIISSIIAFVTIPLVGYISDRIGRRTTYLILSALMALFAIPMMLLINTQNTVLITISMVIGLNVGVQGLSALENVMLPELFGSIHRMTFVALSKEIAGLVSVGFGPTIAAVLVSQLSGSWWPLAIMVAFFSVVTLISAWAAPETNDRDLNELEDPEPRAAEKLAVE